MKKIIVKKGEDCPFYTWYDGAWCSFGSEEDPDEKGEPYCILSSKPSPPCPLLKEGGLVVEFDLDQDVIDFIEK